MTDSSPDTSLTVWLCEEPPAFDPEPPAWLTGHERKRLFRLTGRSYQEFIGSRWLIRQALSQASGEDWSRCRPVDGRPVASAHPAGWALSVSHSHGMSGCAAAAGEGEELRLGLDLEPMGRRPEWQKVVRRWFAPSEQDWLLAGNSCEDFLKVWTLKEAWLKATGRGIANNLTSLQLDAGFNLTGDRSGWMASLGQVGHTLVSLVYKPTDSRPPVGQLVELSGRTVRPIDWLFHRTIGNTSQANKDS